jgi:hypothetical protein
MPELLDVHTMVMSGGRERSRGQYGQLLDAAGWQLAEVTLLPSGQSLLNATAR